MLKVEHFAFLFLPWNVLSVPYTSFCFALLGGHAPVIKFVDRETLLKEKQQQLEVDSFGYVFLQDYAITFFFNRNIFLTLRRFQEQEKKRKLKEEAKKKLELEKVRGHDLSLSIQISL